MADLTRIEMIDRVLEHMGVKAAAQSASAEDAKLVGEVLDSLHERLRGEDLAPFETSAIPKWAQTPFKALVALEAAPSFSLAGAQLQNVAGAARMARSELVKARSGVMHPVPIRTLHY